LNPWRCMHCSTYSSGCTLDEGGKEWAWVSLFPIMDLRKPTKTKKPPKFKIIVSFFFRNYIYANICEEKHDYNYKNSALCTIINKIACINSILSWLVSVIQSRLQTVTMVSTMAPSARLQVTWITGPGWRKWIVPEIQLNIGWYMKLFYVHNRLCRCEDKINYQFIFYYIRGYNYYIKYILSFIFLYY